MNETNALENRLRSWQPRRPPEWPKFRERVTRELHSNPATEAAVVDRQIALGEAPDKTAFETSTAGRAIRACLARWIAPAAACVLFAIAMINDDRHWSSDASQPVPVIALITSNQIAYFSESYQQERNNFSFRTFDWTNQSSTTASNRSFRKTQ